MSNELSTERLKELLKTAKAAAEETPGPWETPLKDLGDYTFDHDYEVYPPLGCSGPVCVTSSPERASHIAAFDPSTCAALVKEVIEWRNQGDAHDNKGCYGY